MIVVFIHGPVAAGKHTIGSLLSERTGLPLFHNHLTVDLVDTLFDFGTEPFNRLRAEIWRRSFAEAARAKQSFIFTFNPEATVDRGLIDELVETVEARDGKVCFVELCCSGESILGRLGNESRRQFGKMTDKALFRKVASEGGFDFPTLPAPVVVVDTDTVEPDEAATQVEEAIAPFRRSR